MANERFIQLLGELLEVTRLARLRWQETAKEDAFRVGLGDGMVRIQSSANEDDDGRHYEVYLMNKQGRVVDELIAWRNSPNYDLLRDLYQEARSSALNMDDVVKSMLSDLREGRTRELPPETEEMPTI
jgi:hypothetical protein